MEQLEQDLLYLDDISTRISNISLSIAGTYDTTELGVEKRAAVYRSGDRVRALIFDLKNLQRILKREETTRWQ